ncbi:MAG: glycosyltransferase family 9 protein [Planctomycetota bacterium]|nr:glycosyltransferase family 9 protein [Planctomycetota bacterium]
MSDRPDNEASAPPARPRRILVVVPSWVGDAVMATPALRMVRRAFPGAFIGLLVRPGIDQVLAGLDVADEVHVERASGVMGPKFVAAKVRPRRYDSALLLTNSFSTALIARIAGIPRRIGYARDLRSMLLTQTLEPPRTLAGAFAPVPAVEYYRTIARELVALGAQPIAELAPRLELVATESDLASARGVMERAGLADREPVAVLNPGGNRDEKRWPADRFARLGLWLRDTFGVRVLVNGSPGERELCGAIARDAGAISLPEMGITLGALKGLLSGALVAPRAMVTNDTGPRHVAQALGVPVVTMFGPTDHRWTTLPVREDAPERILLADPTLPEDLVADEHPERCRVDRIQEEDVRAAVSAIIRR